MKQIKPLLKLREIRKKKGISMTYMAKKLGYKSTSGYANIEYGRVKPSLKKARIIAEILDTDINELFFEENLHEMSNKTA